MTIDVRAFAVHAVCSSGREPSTIFEHNMVRLLEDFGVRVLNAAKEQSAVPEGGDIAKDAARYRWFRENWGVEYDGPNSLKLYTLINSRFRRGLSEPQGFDAAIDGAIAGSSHPPQKEPE